MLPRRHRWTIDVVSARAPARIRANPESQPGLAGPVRLTGRTGRAGGGARRASAGPACPGPRTRRTGEAGGLGRVALSARCLDGSMTPEREAPRVVSASREIAAGPGPIFELIADPAQQPRWDGNDNLAAAPAGQRVRRAGDVFTMALTQGSIRENHVVEFDEGRRIAWRPAEPGRRPPGHLWRWELEPSGPARTWVTCTYDWTQLTDEKRLPRARATTADRLRASLDRLAALAEGSVPALPVPRSGPVIGPARARSGCRRCSARTPRRTGLRWRAAPAIRCSARARRNRGPGRPGRRRPAG